MKKLSLRAATKAVEALLDYKDGSTCKVYLWNQYRSHPKHLGIRVSEISWFKQTGPHSGGGGSYMQTDFPYGGLACFSVERVLIAYTEGWPKDELDEELERMLGACGIKKPYWEEKTRAKR